MASKLIKIGKSDNIPIYTYNVDTEEDMNTIDLQGVPMGSKCYIINDGKWYMLNSEGKWKAMSSSGGGGSVPKPLTYDYMPEGYPTKAMGIATVMEEQELEFAEVNNGVYGSFLTTQLDIVGGQTYTVSWDGTEYECVFVDNGKEAYLGNQSIFGNGNDTGEPFLYDFDQNAFATLDASASHTISVKSTEEIVTPMAEEFLPANAKNTTVFYL